MEEAETHLCLSSGAEVERLVSDGLDEENSFLVDLVLFFSLLELISF